MYKPKYTVENKNLFTLLPISFKASDYIIEITDSASDRGSACARYGVKPVTNNKILIFSIASSPSGFEYNRPDYTGYVLALGF